MDRIDSNDFAHVLRLGLKPVAAQPCPWGGHGVINPHVTRFCLDDGRVTDLFHIKPVYYETPQGHWRPMGEIAAHHGNRRIVLRTDAWGRVSLRYLRWLMARQRLLGSSLTFEGLVAPERLAFAATLTTYPDPDPETTTVDGHVAYEGDGATTAWATMHDAADGTYADDSGTDLLGYVVQYTYIIRVFALFSTSALTADATISAGVFSLFSVLGQNDDNDGDDWFNVVQSNPASNTALATADYDQCGDAISNPTEGATRIDYSSLPSNAYTDWTLDATGRGWISKTGVTKLGLREGHDCLNSEVIGTNARAFYSADNAGTSSDPKLVVTYALPPGPASSSPLRPFIPLLGR